MIFSVNLPVFLFRGGVNNMTGFPELKYAARKPQASESVKGLQWGDIFTSFEVVQDLLRLIHGVYSFSDKIIAVIYIEMHQRKAIKNLSLMPIYSSPTTKKTSRAYTIVTARA